MKIAHNPQTGEYFGLQNGQWQPMRMAKNKDTGELYYLGESGWEKLDTGGAMTPGAQKDDSWRGWGTNLGLGTRAVLEGMGNTAGSLVTPLLNLPGHIFSNGKYNQTFSPDWGTAVSDKLNLPKPETRSDKLLNAAIGGIASNIPFAATGAGLNIARSAPAMASLLWGETLPQALKAQALNAASGALGGGAAEVANQSGGGQAAQLAAGLAGGVLPGAVGTAGNLALRRPFTGIRDAAASMSDTGRDRLAGRAIRSALGDNKAAEQMVLDSIAQGSGEIVPGSVPTLGQLTGHPGLATLERVAANKGLDSGLFAERAAAQQEARNAVLEKIGDAAEGRIARENAAVEAGMPYGMDAGTAGNILRNVYDKNYAEMRRQVGQAYSAIDPEKSARFDVRPLLKDFQDIAARGGRYAEVPASVRKVIGLMEDDVRNGKTLSFDDLQGMRSVFSDLSYQAAAQGDRATQNIAGRMKEQLDDYLQRLSGSEEMQGQFPYPQAGSEAYRQANALAGDMVRADPLYDDLAYLRKMGLNKDETQRILGKAGVETLNTQYPGLVRPSGKLTPDAVAGDLASSKAYGFGGDDFSNRDSQAMLELIQDRLEGGKGRIREDVSRMRDSIIQDAAQPHTGFTPEQADAFDLAKMMRRMQGAQFESGVNNAMSKAGKGLSGKQVDESLIPGRYFVRGPAGRESMTAFNMMAQGNERAMQAMNDYVRNLLRSEVVVNGKVSPMKLKSFQKKYAEALKMLPDVAVEAQRLGKLTDIMDMKERGLKETLRKTGDVWKFSPGRNIDGRYGPQGTRTFTASEVKRLQDVQADMERSRRASLLGSTFGSPTARNISAQADVGEVISPLISRIPGVGWAAKQIFENADRDIWKRVQHAMLEPQYAKELLERGYAPIVPVGSSLKKYGGITGRGGALGGMLGSWEREKNETRRER